MLTDRQSFILSAFVAFGFALSGMLKILDNIVIISVLSIAFVAIIVNVFMNKDFMDDSFEKEQEEDNDVKK